VGGNDELRVDVRMIAATNRDVVAAIRENEFREDLFHRLNVVQLCPPPLRERRSDIPLLAGHFLRLFSSAMNKAVQKISEEALTKLQLHNWPGNVRELRNVIERAVILESTSEVQPRSLPDFHLENRLHKADQPIRSSGQSIDELMGNFERELIMNTLEQHRYNLTRTAEHLKISRHALRYRMQRLNIHGGTDGEEEAQMPGKEVSPC
jgi:DNA-binding NtrC family response regulator